MTVAETAQTGAAAVSLPTAGRALVLRSPGEIDVQTLDLNPPGAGDVVVDVQWSGVSSGTEKLLYTGEMPPFPGMGYPLVPGYESVGSIAWAGAESGRRKGERVFVPGANCYARARGLFGASAERLVVPAERAVRIDAELGADAVLLALAATAQHIYSISCARSGAPELIVGHGVLGRLLARLCLAHGQPAPTVWETEPLRRAGGTGYQVLDSEQDTRADYGTIIDVSGAAGLLDTLVARLRRGGELVLGGFYAQPLHFDFPAAFMREARIGVAAEWQPQDLAVVLEMVESRRLALNGLITHRLPADDAATGYPLAFADPACLKLVLDWRKHG